MGSKSNLTGLKMKKLLKIIDPFDVLRLIKFTNFPFIFKYRVGQTFQ